MKKLFLIFAFLLGVAVLATVAGILLGGKGGGPVGDGATVLVWRLAGPVLEQRAPRIPFSNEPEPGSIAESAVSEHRRWHFSDGTQEWSASGDPASRGHGTAVYDGHDGSDQHRIRRLRKRNEPSSAQSLGWKQTTVRPGAMADRKRVIRRCDGICCVAFQT